MKKNLVLILSSIVLISTLVGCNNVDPNVKNTADPNNTYNVIIDENNETNNTITSAPDVITEHQVYSGGESGDVEVGGIKVNIDDYALRSYELSFLLAQGNFDDVHKIPTDGIVQYAFCHLFFENLYQMPDVGVLYREATNE